MAEYIEREALLNKMKNWHEKISLIACVNSMPAADVAPVRHGRWDRVIPSKSAAKWSSKVSCSVCHNVGYDHFKYCPNCGAKMELEER